MIQTVCVARKYNDVRGDEVLREICQTLGITSVQVVRTIKIFRLEGIDESQARHLAESLLWEKIDQEYCIGELGMLTYIDNGKQAPAQVIEVAYKPGVMNPEVASILKAAGDLGLDLLTAADSSVKYQFYGSPSQGEMAAIIERLLVNKTVQMVVTKEPTTLVISGKRGPIERMPIRELTEDPLKKLSGDRHLFLNLEEMSGIQRHFRELGRKPTDGEVETLAQTWSEHCGHKTFKAKLIVDGVEKPPLIERLKEVSRQFNKGVLSAFVDNSGVIEFYDGWAICGKVETHNSPSAIEPYGGAMTGSGGVFRDIMGTGQGAKAIVSTDMFCLASPGLPNDQIPPGCLHPRYLFRKVIDGVRDYGNRMGIPTNNGSVHFHPDFRAKPSVIVGAYGIIPAIGARKGIPHMGDTIIAVGGRTGRDGIHGATVSSGEMGAQTNKDNAGAVQIGNAIEEKRMADALLACRDEELIRAITDCGAGGFASAIGEMGSELGVVVHLEGAPLKYQGLTPWEIWISESQERMVLAAAPEHVEQIMRICQLHNVEATMLGQFTGDGQLRVLYESEVVCDLSMQFLHHGLPQRVLEAHWEPPVLQAPNIPLPQSQTDWVEAFKKVLAHGNVCSKEPIVRQYDHSVQGASALPPFSGVHHDGPNDAVVIRPLLDKPYGVVVSHGLNPILNKIDPYWGSLWAIVEALANYAAVGGDICQGEAALIDNFIWPSPDKESLGALDRAVDACVDAARAFGIPYVSGKDSLSSTYRHGDFVLKIPSVLNISVFGRIPDVAKTITADFKDDVPTLVLIGTPDWEAMGGSTYLDIHGQLGDRIPKVDLQRLPSLFQGLHRLIKLGQIQACHDISEGGLAATVFEMCVGGNCGALIDLDALPASRPDWALFNETAGCFVAQMYAESIKYLKNSGLTFVRLGYTVPQPVIQGWCNNQPLFKANLADLKTAWQRPMKEVFHS